MFMGENFRLLFMEIVYGELGLDVRKWAREEVDLWGSKYKDIK